jgi:hypothetical protein
MKVDRRGFLLLAGGAASGAAVGGLTLTGISRINAALAPEMASYPGEEKIVTSICHSCSGGCGLQVRMVGGRVVKLDGNPLYPVNRGICPRLRRWHNIIRIAFCPGGATSGTEMETIPWQALQELSGTLQLRSSAQDRSRW